MVPKVTGYFRNIPCLSHLNSRKVYIKLETAVMRYRKCTVCAAVVTGNRRIWCSSPSQALIRTHASVLPCLSVSLLCLRVQTRPVWLFGAECRLALYRGEARQVVSGFGAWRVLRHSLSVRTAVEQEATNSTKQSPSWKANSFSASQSTRILWNPKVRHRVHKNPRTGPSSAAGNNNTRECYIQEKIRN